MLTMSTWIWRLHCQITFTIFVCLIPTEYNLKLKGVLWFPWQSCRVQSCRIVRQLLSKTVMPTKLLACVRHRWTLTGGCNIFVIICRLHQNYLDSWSVVFTSVSFTCHLIRGRCLQFVWQEKTGLLLSFLSLSGVSLIILFPAFR